MTIKGFLERVTPERIAGWCIDDAAEDVLDVEVRINSIRLGVVRADLPRPDVRRKRWRAAAAAGFQLPVSRKLFRLFPHGGRVQAFVNGEALPTLKGCNPHVDNPDGAHHPGRLAEMLANGYLISPKSGGISRPLKDPDVAERLLGALEVCSRVFHEVTGERFFVCYGTLLGLVREGKLIEHDDDVDVCFLAKAQGLDAAVQEFGQVVSALRSHGQRIAVIHAGQFHWHAPTGALDVFMAWWEDDHLYMYNAGGKLRRDQILPLRGMTLAGRAVLVPNDPEALLEMIYGVGWRHPDPSFQWRATPELGAKMRRLQALPVRDAVLHDEIKRHWSRFYKELPHTTIPSPFAATVAVELDEPCSIIDLGCGNGRDALFLAGLGHQVRGFDVSEAAIKEGRLAAARQGLGNVAFDVADVAVPGVLRDLIGSRTGAGPLVVYGRFFFHAVEEEEEAQILDALSRHLPAGARCHFEFRTAQDAKTHKHFGDHYRRFIGLDEFIRKATRGGAMACVYKVEGRGMAKFGAEDPVVARVHLHRQ